MHRTQGYGLDCGHHDHSALLAFISYWYINNLYKWNLCCLVLFTLMFAIGWISVSSLVWFEYDNSITNTYKPSYYPHTLSQAFKSEIVRTVLTQLLVLPCHESTVLRFNRLQHFLNPFWRGGPKTNMTIIMMFTTKVNESCLIINTSSVCRDDCQLIVMIHVLRHHLPVILYTITTMTALISI